jgi:hypothetical protein
MDKLIELLLEYKPQIHYLDKPKWVYDKKYWIGWYKREWDIGWWFSEEVIISKKFWFIQRLIENDKIDLYKLDEKAERKPQYAFTDDDWRLWFKLFEVYESLLMLLSISSSPIEDLISYLK